MKDWMKLVCAGFVLLLALPLAAQTNDRVAPGGQPPLPDGTKLTLTMTFADGTTMTVPVSSLSRGSTAESATGRSLYVVTKPVDAMTPLLYKMLEAHTTGKLAVIEMDATGVSKTRKGGMVNGSVSVNQGSAVRVSAPRVRVIKKLSATLEEVALDSASGQVTYVSPTGWIGYKPGYEESKY